MSSFEDYYRARRESPATAMTEPPAQEDSLPEIKQLSEKELMKDKDFIANAWNWYNTSKQFEDANISAWRKRGRDQMMRGMKPKEIVDDQDVAEWAVLSASKFNNNFAQMAVDWQQMRKQPVGNIKSMMAVIDAYSQTETSGRQVARGVAHAASDPFSWAGFTLLAKSATKGMPQNQTKGYLRSMISKTINNPVAVVAVEGAAFAGGMGAAEEDLNSTAQARDFNTQVPMIYAGVGALLGGGLGSTPMLMRGIKQKFKGWRGNGEGATMTDSKVVAEQYGDDVTQKEIEAHNPVFFNDEITVDELADRLDLDEKETSDLVAAITNGGDARTPLKTAEAMQQEPVQQALMFRDVDMVGYPEKLDGLDLSEAARLSRANEQGFDTNKVWYHGSKSDFKAFNDDAINSRFDSSIGHHFTNNPAEAGQYAEGEGGNVMQAYTRTKNPLIITTGKKSASLEADINRADILSQIDKAKSDGNPYDAVIINRRVGDGNDDSNFISLNSENIKSTTAKFATTASGVAVSGDLLAKEVEDENSSLDVDGVSMTYRQVGGAE